MSAIALAQGGARIRTLSIIAFLALLLVFCAVYSITLGRYDVGMAKVALILWDNIFPIATPTWTPVEADVVEAIRLPRILAALVIGAGLSISGAALQGMFRNPLLDPGIIGVTAGAGFGGTLAILLVGGGTVVLGAAFVIGMGSMIIVRLLASVKGRTSTLTLVLAGVVVTAFFESAISIIKLLADPHQKLPAITYWLMGSIAGTNYESLALMTLAILPASFVIYLLRYQINILSLGEDKARALGAPIELVQWIILAAVSIISAGVVATSGIVAWVGLIIPHMARGLVGPDHGRLLPVSALIGAIYLLLVDNLARTVTIAEIPLGIITTLIAVPFFAVIMRRIQSRSGWSDD
jgi:iron complex transport system permease protein